MMPRLEAGQLRGPSETRPHCWRAKHVCVRASGVPLVPRLVEDASQVVGNVKRSPAH